MAERMYGADLARIEVLRIASEGAGVKFSKQLNGKIQHDYVLDVFNAEQARGADMTSQFVTHQKDQWRATLSERYKARRNTYCYEIKNGQLYADNFQNESFATVVGRGEAYLGEERTKREIRGIGRLESYFTREDAQNGDMAVLFSPTDGTNRYTENFVNIYQLFIQQNTGRRFVKGVIYNTDLTMEEYAQLAQHLDPNFSHDDAFPADASEHLLYVGKPIGLGQVGKDPDKVFAHMMEYIEKPVAKDDAEMEELYALCLPWIMGYINILTQQPFDTPEAWRQLGWAYRSILGAAQKVMRGEKEAVQMPFSENSIKTSFTNVSSHTNIPTYAQMRSMGSEKIEQVQAGCGSSVAPTIGGGGDGTVVSAMRQHMKQTLGRLADNASMVKSNEKSESSSSTISGTCPGCGYEVEAAIEDCKVICPTSGCVYSKEVRNGTYRKSEPEPEAPQKEMPKKKAESVQEKPSLVKKAETKKKEEGRRGHEQPAAKAA